VPWPTTARWAETVTRTHELRAYAEILADGLPVLSTLDSADLLLTAATVTVADGVLRRTATLTLVDVAEQLGPVAEKALIIPGDGEVRLYGGLRYWDWTPAETLAGTDIEYVPAFTGPIMSYDLADYPVVRLTCADRMWYCQRPLTVPYAVTPTTTVDDAIASLLAGKVPPAKLATNIPTTGLVTGLMLLDEQSDPSDALKRMATAAGWVLYPDPMGTFIAEDEPGLDPDQVVATYAAGPGGALIRPRLAGDVQNIVNTWIVTGEAADNGGTAVPWAKVTDDDPTSLTYVRGPYDERPRFISSPLMRTDAQCRLAAETYRRREGGLADSVAIAVLANAAREKGDVMQVIGGLVDRLVIADAFDLDLFGGQQEITARAGTAPSSG
jgi:hypothetical protein